MKVEEDLSTVQTRLQISSRMFFLIVQIIEQMHAKFRIIYAFFYNDTDRKHE